MRLRALFVILLAVVIAPAFGQVATVTFTASKLANLAGKPVTGQLCITPTNSAGAPVGFQFGGGGQGTQSQTCFAVTAGAFSAPVVDTALSNPANVCLAAQLLNPSAPPNQRLVRSWSCLQPASTGQYWCSTASGVTTCNLDNYIPTDAANALVVAGPTGATGPQGASAITGMSGDGLGNATLTGKFTASNVVAGTPIANTSGGTGCSGVNCYFNMPRWRSKVANVINGTGYARIMFPGDSTLFGINASVATSVGVDFCADLTTYYSIPCHADSWMGGGNSGNGTYWQSDTRISAGTGWGEGGLATIGVQSLTQSASGGALTFTPTGLVDTFEVYYIQQPSGGVLNVAVDSGTATAINTAGTASMQKAVISASGVGSHVLSHVWSGGGRVDLVGDIAYDSTTPSAIVVLAGAGGSTSAQWSNTSAAYGPGQSAPYSTLGLDAAVVEGGLINDWINSVAPSVSQTHLQTIASALLTAGVDVAFYTPVPSRTATTAQVIQAASVAAMKAVATANHNNNTTQTLPIIDNFSQWGTQAAHSSLWYGGNAVHPNATGYAINAQSVETTIVQSPSQVGGFNVGPWVAGQSIMATSFAPNSVVVAGPYQLLCTEGSVFISGGTLTLPSTCPNNYQVQIVTFTSSSVTIAGSLLDASVPTSLAGKSGLVVQFVGGHWWPVARFTNASATALQLSAVLESGNYTALGTEGTIYVNGGTLTLPGLSSIYSGFTVPIINYGSATTISIGGTNHGIPTILPASASALVQYYNSSWWLIAEHGVSDLGSTPTASSGSVTGVNTGGIISGLSGVTSVTLTFAGNPWTTWASCGPTASVSGVIPTISSASTSAFTFSFPSAYTGTLYYLCNGK